ncbi:hypothetical protein QR685DRAFT_177499 [Neurospora intermedia]|uniref:Uncharacterized protein n=1 Tax=Neurospora intermedia TaxID=5142 RepID=A0ABR3DLK3_NEUIN
MAFGTFQLSLAFAFRPIDVSSFPLPCITYHASSSTKKVAPFVALIAHHVLPEKCHFFLSGTSMRTSNILRLKPALCQLSSFIKVFHNDDLLVLGRRQGKIKWRQENKRLTMTMLQDWERHGVLISL